MMRWSNGLAAAVLSLVVLVQCAANESEETKLGAIESNDMNATVEYPNFEPGEFSPDLEQEGIAIAVSKGARQTEDGTVHRTVYLHGTYAAGSMLLNRTNGMPFTWIIVTVVRRDQPSIWSKTVMNAANKPAPSSRPPEEPGAGDELTIGSFNVDLRKFFPLPEESGSYYVTAWFGNYTSERLPFDIVVDEKR